MDRSEGLLILYSSTLTLKVLAYLLTLALITIFSGGLHGFLFLFIPLALDVHGAGLVKLNHKAFTEDVLENLEAECLRACGIDKAQPFYPFHEITGAIDHWMLKDFRTDVAYTMMAPKEDFVVIAARKGRIFPLKSLFPVAYQIDDAGTRDVYYNDITAVELAGKVLTMTCASGEAVAYTAQGDDAARAADHLRERLRRFKSRRDAAPEA